MKLDLFLLGVAFIFIHELDAIRCKEWRIFPGLSYLSDRVGMVLFIFLHIPLFYWVLLEIKQGSEGFRLGIDIYLIAHLILHLAYMVHRKNEFKNWISWSIISGAGICGALDLLLN